jgi:hypothetical protein
MDTLTVAPPLIVGILLVLTGLVAARAFGRSR